MEDPIIWDNGRADIGWNQLSTNISADDFQLEQDKVITDAHFWPCEVGTEVWDNPVQWYVYDDDNGKPGNLLFNGDGINIVGEFTERVFGNCNEFEVSFDLDNPPSLESGIDYWFGFHAGLDGVYNNVGININLDDDIDGSTYYRQFGGVGDWSSTIFDIPFYLTGVDSGFNY